MASTLTNTLTKQTQLGLLQLPPRERHLHEAVEALSQLRVEGVRAVRAAGEVARVASAPCQQAPAMLLLATRLTRPVWSPYISRRLECPPNPTHLLNIISIVSGRPWSAAKTRAEVRQRNYQADVVGLLCAQSFAPRRLSPASCLTVLWQGEDGRCLFDSGMLRPRPQRQGSCGRCVATIPRVNERRRRAVGAPPERKRATNMERMATLCEDHRLWFLW